MARDASTQFSKKRDPDASASGWHSFCTWASSSVRASTFTYNLIDKLEINTINTIRVSLLISLVASSAVLSLSGCAGEVTSAPQTSVAVPADNDPKATAAVKDAVEDLKQHDPGADVELSADGTLLTGDPDTIKELAKTIVDKYEAGNVAMGKRSFCFIGGTPMTEGYCHRGSYRTSFAAQLDRQFNWPGYFIRETSCDNPSVAKFCLTFL